LDTAAEVEKQGIAVLGRANLRHLALHHDLLADVVLGLIGGDDREVSGRRE
jgi:hypothetical protein